MFTEIQLFSINRCALHELLKKDGIKAYTENFLYFFFVDPAQKNLVKKIKKAFYG